MRNLISSVLVLILTTTVLSAQTSRPAAPAADIKTTPVRGGVSMLEGRGGNIGVFVGDDGVLMIDDQFAPVAPMIAKAIDALSTKPIKFLVNTHHHGDHTGGNTAFAKNGVTIVAHDNVRKNMIDDQANRAKREGKTTETDTVPLPVITFDDGIKFHWNGDDVLVRHLAPAHTDGDSVIHFTKANVIHTGDLFFNGSYPVIDAAHGGSIDGMIKNAEAILAMTNADTLIIPGHGPLAKPADLQAFHDMLVGVRKTIVDLLKENATIDDVVAAKPTKAYDEIWGKGFMKPDGWVKNVATMLSAKK